MNHTDEVESKEIKKNTDDINKTQNIDTENINYVENTNNNEKIDNVDNSGNAEINDYENENKNYISLYTKSEPANISDDVDSVYNSKNKENYDPGNMDTNYSSSHTQSKLQDTRDMNGTVSKPNSLTLGEVRQALNNGMFEDILPMGGPVYRVNNSKDTNNSDHFVNDVVNSIDTQVIMNLNNINYLIYIITLYYFSTMQNCII